MLCEEGELDGFEAFCEVAYPQLVGALAHHFGDRQLAEDLAQESLIRAGARWGRVGTLDSPVGWAYHVGCNLGRSTMRRRAAESRALSRGLGSPDDVSDGRAVDRIVVWGALRQLADRQRQAVICCYFLGLSSQEAGEALGMAPATVRVQVHRALVRLRELLADGTTTTDEGRRFTHAP